jgi:hypothetical protein
MTGLIAAVIPPPTKRLSRTGPSPSSARRPLPLAALRTASAGSAVYAVVAIDCNGRVAERAVAQALQWSPGTTLNVQIRAGLICVRAHSAGDLVVSGAGYIRLPAPLRHRCGLVPGARMLLAADPEQALLVIYPPSTLQSMITAFQTEIVRGEP